MRRRRSWLSEIPDWKLHAFAILLAFVGTFFKVLPEYIALFHSLLKT